MDQARARSGRADRRGLTASGDSRSRLEPLQLVAGAELVHIPDAERPRVLVPLQEEAVRFALERLGRETWGWRAARLAGRVGLGRALLRARFPLRGVRRSDGVRSLLELTGEPGPFVVHVGTGGDLVVYLLRDRDPASVAKVSAEPARLEREKQALSRLGAAARAAGADVPRPLAAHEVDGVAVLVETPVAGRPLAWTLPGRARRFRDALERIADWLAAWHRLTVRPLDGEAIPHVAAHCDLTSSNVLFDGDRLAIVDWEHARPDGLPLTDFLYAAADLAWAVDRRDDRLAAFEECFAAGGRWAEVVGRLERQVRDAVGVSEEAAAACFHACWAHHAANELRASGGRPGAFAALAARAAELRR